MSLQWDEVKKVVITDDKKKVGIFCENESNVLLVTLPNKEDIISMIKTFCSKKIETAEDFSK